MVRTLSAAALLVALAGGAPVQARRAPAPEAECARAGARSAGGAVRSLETRFALPARPEVFRLRFDSEECLVFLGVSRPSQDLDLSVHATSGLELARDDAPRAWAWAGLCGLPGQEVAVTVRTRTRGRFAFAVLAGAPMERPDLGRRVGRCFAGEPGRAAERDERGDADLDDADLASMARRLAVGEDAAAPGAGEPDAVNQGAAEPEVRHGRLREGRAQLRIGVEAGRCYRIAGRSDRPGLYLEGDVAGSRWRTPPHERAIIGGCPVVDGELELWLDGPGDARFVVAVASWRAEAVEPHVVARVHLLDGERIALPHRPSAPCVTLRAQGGGAGHGAERGVRDLRMRIRGGPRDARPSPTAEVHVCDPGPLWIEVRSVAGRGTVDIIEEVP
ncbi:MAG: hypothetical protein CMN30_00675 [Sandaracinus sp.]|nr:hypothetical protein [Sandaracinus sp.]